MSDATTNGPECISAEELAEYCQGLLLEDRNGDIEVHFARCDLCAQQARQFYTAQTRRFAVFTQIWDGWTAKTHGEAYQRDAAREQDLPKTMAVALQIAAQAYPNWQERLRQWQKQWGGKAEAARRVIVRVSQATSRVMTESLESLVRPGGGWPPAPVSVPVRPRHKPLPPPNLRVLGPSLSPDKPRERVTVSGEAGAVQVRVEGWPAAQQVRPLVVLVSIHGESEPQVVELVEEEAGVLIARFASVELGEYVVALEPLGQSDTAEETV